MGVEFCHVLFLNLLIQLCDFFFFSLLIWWITNVEIDLHPWDKSHLVMAQNYLYTLLNLLAILVEDFAYMFKIDIGLAFS